MIDPGHGGKDPGAIAPDGVFEKNITLATGLTCCIAPVAHRPLPGGDDPLDRCICDAGRPRRRRGVSQGGSVLSLHCDHLPEPDLRGASVFTLSNKASDGLAAGVAADENSADSFGRTAAGVSPQVAGILASLETRATRIGSATLAEDIQQSFTGIVPLLPDPHRSANFAVLRNPSTPSTLLEMGCLTNPLDEKLLKSPAHRRTDGGAPDHLD